jgi:hypothetical protein
MEITIRNITKDTMIDFNNDHTIMLPMDEDKLQAFLKNDEWIIVDSQIGEEFDSIIEINRLLTEFDYDTLMILSSIYSFADIKGKTEDDFAVVDFDGLTAKWYGGSGGFSESDKGQVLFEEGYISLPFEYKEEMEDYIRWENLWTEAQCNGWVDLSYNGNTYLVARH